MSTTTTRIAVLPVLCAAVLSRTSAAAQLPTTERVSVSSAGVQANNETGGASISADGRWVAFYGSASNLVAGDTNNQGDVFVRDRLLGTTERVSVHSSGAQANFASLNPVISADGRRVAFVSYASNLVDDDTNGWWEIFVRDRQTGLTERASVSSAGTEGNGASTDASISADGRYVAFASNASNLVSGDTNATIDVFVRDVVLGVTARASLAWDGSQPNFDSRYTAISGDGRYVAFRSSATNLVVGDTNNLPDIFVRDLQLGTTVLASVGVGGASANADNRNPAFSEDGRFLAFESAATNLVVGDLSGFTKVFVRDLVNATTVRVSVDSSGAPANANCLRPSLTADGRVVAFHSDAANLVSGDTNFSNDVFVHDRTTGQTSRVSLTTGGAEVAGSNSFAAMSSDGRYLAFESTSSGLVPGDTNGVNDIFLRDRGAPPPVVYCTAGTTTSGCNASITASANPSVSLANACVLSVAGSEGQKTGLLFYGIDNSGFTPATWGAGSTSFRCVKPPTQRTSLQNSGGNAGACDGTYVLDWNALQTANPTALGNPWSAGAKVYAQSWFRDPPAVKSTNLSNAVELTYVP